MTGVTRVPEALTNRAQAYRATRVKSMIGPRDRPSGSGADCGFHRVGQSRCSALHEVGLIPFDHHPDDGLGSGCPKHHAATVAKLLFRSLTGGPDSFMRV